MKKMTLFLVDDQILFLDMLSNIVKNRAEDMEVVGTASSGEDALKKISAINPDIVLLDVKMPGIDGLQVLSKIKQINCETIVLMLTTFQDVEKAKKCMEAGASGFLLKNMSVNDLIDKVRAVSRGDVLISSQIAEKIFTSEQNGINKIEKTQMALNDEDHKRLENLSKREMEVYKLLRQGYSNAEIAEKLFIARQTVKNHIYSIYTKIGYHDRFKIISGKR